MRVLRHYTDVPAEALGTVAALGNFDGVHRGHAAVIDEARAEAERLDAPLSVVTFEPHPRSFFRPDSPPFRLTSLRSKAHRLQLLGVDYVFALHFDEAFSRKLAQEFVMDVLVGGLRLRHVVVGYDFVFGRQRGGGAAVLGWMAEMEGFGLSVIEPAASENGEIFSSTRIREHLAAGRPQAAADLLGHWWSIEGKVLPGDRRGRTIGFPTANVALEGYLVPALGVYAVRLGLEDSAGGVTWHDGVANLGRRPTFDKQDLLLEVHLFDFAGDIYGRHVRVELIEYLRAEQKFPGLDALKAAIAADSAAARAVLADPRNQDFSRFGQPVPQRTRRRAPT